MEIPPKSVTKTSKKKDKNGKKSPEAQSTSSAGKTQTDEPLLIKPVMNRILSYLNVNSLKNSRLVCRKWATESAPFIYRKSIFTVSSGEKLNYLRSVFPTINWDKPSSSSLDEKKDFYEKYNFMNIPDLFAMVVMAKLGKYMKKMTVSISNTTSTSSSFTMNEEFDPSPMPLVIEFLDYCFILHGSCPKLEDLHLNIMGIKPHPQQYNQLLESRKNYINKMELEKKTLPLKKIRMSGEWLIPPSELLEISRFSPSLKSIQITDLEKADDRDYPTKFFEHLNTFSPESQEMMLTGKLESLKLGEFVPLDSSAIHHFTKISTWNLKKLFTFLDSSISDAAFSNLMTHIQGTIQVLHLQFYSTTFGWQFHADASSLKEKCWLLPPGMKELKKLTVHADREDILSTILWTAVKLPALEELDISNNNFKNIPVSLTFDEVWNSSKESFASIRDEALQFATASSTGSQVRKLKISIKSQPVYELIIKNLYPNVEDLTLFYPTADILSATFIHFGKEKGEKLKHFSIQFQDYPEKLDSILTGIRHKIVSAMYAKKLYKFADPAQIEKIKINPSLRDLSGLVTFELTCETPSKFKLQPSQSNVLALTDVLIHYGLTSLKNCQRISLKFHKFTEEALEKLRGELLYFCHLDLVEASSPQQRANRA